MDASLLLYKKVLQYDANSVEAISCLAAHYFYAHQPELSLKYFRRLLQMGVTTTELWCNLGLSCFYSAQYDLAVSCIDRALALASDDVAADVWYNVGHVAVCCGDAGLAYQAFRVAVVADPTHAEAHSCLGVLEMRKAKANVEAARNSFLTAQVSPAPPPPFPPPPPPPHIFQLAQTHSYTAGVSLSSNPIETPTASSPTQKFGDYLFEPFYNGALLSQKMGNYEEAFIQVKKALVNCPEHAESNELLANLRTQFGA